MANILPWAPLAGPIYSRIQKVSYSEANIMDVTLGHRQKEIADIWGLVKPGA